jgi:hypothetical protein
MMAPRPTLITNNALDSCCFRGDYANSPLIWAARPFFALYNAADKLTYHINFDKGHNYGQDNREAFYRFLNHNFDRTLPLAEIQSESEIRTPDQLRVQLPADNLDFNKIALQLSRTPGTRQTLSEVVRPKTYTLQATQVPSMKRSGVQVKQWRLRMDNDWTVPAVEMGPSNASGAVILLGDQGRAALASEAQRLVAEGKRVIAVDVFGFGESRIPKRDHLFALLVSSIGDRPIGIQASQINAIARWLKGPVAIEAFGPRSSMIATVAARLEARPLKTHDALPSLNAVLEKNMALDAAPELFCFGLLQALADTDKAATDPR